MYHVSINGMLQTEDICKTNPSWSFSFTVFFYEAFIISWLAIHYQIYYHTCIRYETINDITIEFILITSANRIVNFINVLGHIQDVWKTISCMLVEHEKVAQKGMTLWTSFTIVCEFTNILQVTLLSSLKNHTSPRQKLLLYLLLG